MGNIRWKSCRITEETTTFWENSNLSINKFSSTLLYHINYFDTFLAEAFTSGRKIGLSFGDYNYIWPKTDFASIILKSANKWKSLGVKSGESGSIISVYMASKSLFNHLSRRRKVKLWLVRFFCFELKVFKMRTIAYLKPV